LSPTDGLTPQYAMSFILSPQYRKSSTFASSPTGVLLSETPMPMSANTVYTATSPVSSRIPPSLQTTTAADLSLILSPKNVSSLYDTSSITSRNSLISSSMCLASPPAVLRTDNFYSKYSGVESPSYANIVATAGHGWISDSRATPLSPLGYTGLDRGHHPDTPPPGSPVDTSYIKSF
jgi:hypothetical protein